MRVTERLRRARSAWTRLNRPVDRFRRNDGGALTYGIECDLDHQADYVDTILGAIDRNDPSWDFLVRAGDELRDLLSFRERLASLEEDLPPYATELLEYMNVTVELLEAVIEASGAQEGDR
jgi:hypothetical protein